ncbi:MAG TPA: YfiR family protein [candidate division Zixibacteria bacterium]|nr:YfiR family protein [candidate division Zixibacteria bacterium]
MTAKALTSRLLLFQIRISLAACLVFSGLTEKALPQTHPPAEYALKAVFLYNFTNFVAWPDSAFADSQSAIVIGVLGDDPYGIYLDETVRNELVNNRPLKVERFSRAEEVKECHVLYISHSEESHAREIVDSLKQRSILTVADADGFGNAGVMIRFATEKKKIKLKIDVEAAKKAELTISSKLLRLADIVKPRKD